MRECVSAEVVDGVYIGELFRPLCAVGFRMRVKCFEDLIVWQKARDLSVAIYRLTSQGAFSRDFGLRDQIRRAAVSVMSNIAEGFGRYSRSELRQFLSIARGSVSEVRCQLYLARELDYVGEADHRRLHELCLEIAKMLSALRASIDRSEPLPH